MINLSWLIHGSGGHFSNRLLQTGFELVSFKSKIY